MSYLIKNAHFIFIHVPIAMLLFSFVFDVLAVAWKKKEWHTAGLLCLVVGALGAIAAVMTGPDGERNVLLLLPQHELYGKLTMAFSILLVLIRVGFLWKKRRDIGNNLVYLVGALIVVGLVSYTGHLGGKMVHPDKGELRDGNFIPGGGFNRQRPKNEGGVNGQRSNGGQRPYNAQPTPTGNS